MAITNEQRQQAEERASEIQLKLYAEPEAGEQLWNIATKFDITERSVYYTFTQMVGDIILGFYKISDTLQLIQYYIPTLDPMSQLELETEIKKFLLPLIASTSTTPATATTNTNQIAKSLTITQTRPEPEPPIYQSSQDALLRTSEANNTPDTPRWETE